LDTSNPVSNPKVNVPMTHKSVDGKKLIFSGGISYNTPFLGPNANNNDS
jgi:hypothetical protein